MDDSTSIPDGLLPVTQADRDAAYAGPYATVQHRKPVNGARDYFVVDFAGYGIEFHQGEFDLHSGKATNKANDCANAINSALEQIAARSRISTQAPNDAVGEAILGVVAATRAYLPPDGISEKECISRILQATDNATISPIILEIENGRS